MHIAIATMQYGSGYYQGTERYIENLGLRRRGNRVTILAGDPENKLTHTQAIGSHTTPHPPEIVSIPTFGWHTVHGGKTSDYSDLLEKLNIDIFHLVHPGHIGLNLFRTARDLGIKSVITVTDYWWLCPKNTLITPENDICQGNPAPTECLGCIARPHPNDLIQRLSGIRLCELTLKWKISSQAGEFAWSKRSAVTREAIESADHVITLSHTAKSKLSAHYRLPASTLIPVRIQQKWFENNPLRQRHDLENRPLTLGFAGTVSPHKGLHILISALERLKEELKINLHIAGEIRGKSYYAGLRSRIKQSNLRVRWLGRLAQAEMITFIDSVDLMVIPSLSPENQPQIILESYARSRPIISSNVPGAAKLVPGQYTYEAFNPEALTATIADRTKHQEKPSIPVLNTTDQMVASAQAVYNSVWIH